MPDSLQLRVHGDRRRPALVYLPGLHGDWTLISSFREQIAGQICFVDITYPRTTAWTLRDYAQAIRSGLVAEGISRAWLLAESFGSQVSWAILGQEGGPFSAQGLILAGGFVRHPVIWGVRAARHVSDALPAWLVRALLRSYGAYAGFRHRHAPETRAEVGEFIRRRLVPEDRQAIGHRLRLIAGHDPRSLAGRISLPVFSLVGLVDPLVPAVPVWLWLRRNSPGYGGTRLILNADHNVLATAPRQSAGQVLRWMQSAGA